MLIFGFLACFNALLEFLWIIGWVENSNTFTKSSLHYVEMFCNFAWILDEYILIYEFLSKIDQFMQKLIDYVFLIGSLIWLLILGSKDGHIIGNGLCAFIEAILKGVKLICLLIWLCDDKITEVKWKRVFS